MARKRPNPIVRAVTDLMWERDKLEMKAIDAVLSVVAPRKRRPAKPRRRPTRNKPR